MDNTEKKMQELALQLLQLPEEALQGVQDLINEILSFKQGSAEGDLLDEGGSCGPAELPGQ